ncbi:MAG: RNA-binding protein [Clostridiales bacterium]|nr:RNA-binding protein [Candidatus Coliplasma equi]
MDLTGHLRVSLAGRDKGRVCAVVGVADEENFVLIADGKMRKVESPKKKKLKHLKEIDWAPAELTMLPEGEKITNRSIRESIARVEEFTRTDVV